MLQPRSVVVTVARLTLPVESRTMVSRLLAIALFLTSWPAWAAPEGESDLAGVLDAVRLGRIDVCRDPQWANWRFTGGDDGKGRLDKLKALADAALAKSDVDAKDPLSAVEERGRLAALTSIIGAVQSAPDRAAWHAAMRPAERWSQDWSKRVAAVQGANLAATSMRRTLWSRAAERLHGERRVKGEVVGGIESCVVQQPWRVTTYLFRKAVIAVLDEGRWPTDERDGLNAAMDALDVVDGGGGQKFVSKNWRRLDDAAREGRIPRGALALIRVTLNPDPDSPAKVMDLKSRVDDEWPQIEAFLSNLPPPRDAGAELTRRTRLEQYGRFTLSKIWSFEAESSDRSAAADGLWARVEAQDKNNTARVKAMLQTRDWFDDDRDGAGAEANGWLIVQHADLDPDFQRDALRRLEPLLPAGRVRPDHYALLWDRVAVKDERPQRYGTQVTCEGGKRVAIGGVEDPAHLDERRKDMGLGPWNEYLGFFPPCS